MSGPRGIEFGVLLLIARLLHEGLDRIPPVTMAFIVIMVCMFTRYIPLPWQLDDVCLSAHLVLSRWDLRRVFLSPFEHVDDMHLYFNLISFLWKGIYLENRFTSTTFLCILSTIIPIASFVYVNLAWLFTIILQDSTYMKQCAVGFSGIVFALKVISTYYLPYTLTTFLGLRVPCKWLYWFELAFIQVVLPNASFVGHMCGVIAGLLYVIGPLEKWIFWITQGKDPPPRDATNNCDSMVVYREAGPQYLQVPYELQLSSETFTAAAKDYINKQKGVAGNEGNQAEQKTKGVRRVTKK